MLTILNVRNKDAVQGKIWKDVSVHMGDDVIAELDKPCNEVTFEGGSAVKWAMVMIVPDWKTGELMEDKVDIPMSCLTFMDVSIVSEIANHYHGKPPQTVRFKIESLNLETPEVQQ